MPEIRKRSLGADEVTEVSEFGRFHAYDRGWKHGAWGKSQAEEFVNHTTTKLKEEYLQGWKDGHEAKRQARESAMKRIGYVPSVLRTAP